MSRAAQGSRAGEGAAGGGPFARADPLAAPPSEDQALQDLSQLPRDAKLISLILGALNVQEYEPKVIPQLLEFMHRYIIDILTDAQAYAEHAGRTHVELADIRLAVEALVSHAFTKPPSKDFLLTLAQEKNRMPLPSVPADRGELRLPPEKYTLTGINFQVMPQSTDARPTDAASRPTSSDPRAFRGTAAFGARSGSGSGSGSAMPPPAAPVRIDDKAVVAMEMNEEYD